MNSTEDAVLLYGKKEHLYYNSNMEVRILASRQKKYENLVVCACWERRRDGGGGVQSCSMCLLGEEEGSKFECACLTVKV